jgi:hypothetical protein
MLASKLVKAILITGNCRCTRSVNTLIAWLVNVSLLSPFAIVLESRHYVLFASIVALLKWFYEPLISVFFVNKVLLIQTQIFCMLIIIFW